ncbi:hypothetical protein CgunFtcFv8_026315 [Champsocephalus gunnari]|uniref:Uncharacterized protein n=1 Tax=Champsocephalus gunnari TaxID=52237 RepID=A0AAN8H3R1_CHAGU|nr:hypothetical protein CgunFtcFv8_026315 [Champsocephalus gunnari]
MDKARTAITQHRGDPSNRRHLLGFFEIQFGLFRRQTFRWVVENSLGYAAYLVAAMKRDPTGGCKDSKEHALSKGMFKEYIELFPSGRIAIAMKEEQYAANAPQHTPPAQVTPPAQHLTTTEHAAFTQQAGTSQHASTSSLRSLLVGQNVPNQRSLTNAVKRLVSPSKTKPSLVHARAQPTPHLIQLPVSFEAAKAPASALTHPAVSSEVNDSTLLAEAVQFEEENPAAQRVCLPAGWTHTLPEVDQRSELALHCRRITRGTEETKGQIHRLIQAFDGDAGRDSLGVPLINSARMSEIIKSQWKHVACIQDLTGVQLYAQTGSSVKGGHRLPTYRCARGSTSLESFHLHLNRFIPGTLASDTFFQAYLLDGLARWNEDRAAAATRDEQQHPHCYNHLLRHAVNTLAEEVLGKKIIPYVGPRKYTGELIGVEYLYQQTGQVLQDYKLAIQESESSEVAIEVHEGHAEPEEFQDFTVPTFHLQRLPAASSKAPSSVSPSPSTSTLSSLSVVPPPSSTSTLSSLSVVPPPSPSTSTLSSLSVVPPPSSTSTLSSLSVVPPPSSTSTLSSQQSTSVDDCVGPDNIEGYGAVQELAEFLFGLREHLLALSGDECTKIITLWQALGDFDKRKTIYPPRDKNTLKQGRFRATKKIVAPGVESTTRCFIGAHSPAQWPDCNRVVEAIFTRLCDLYKNSVHCEGKRVSRLTMVIRVYKHIRECVITNAKVMTETTIQLPEVNVATVTQWFSGRCRSQEQQILKQGIPAPDAPMAGPEKLLLAMQKGTSLFPGSLAEPHAFVLPPNTAGEAKLQKRSQPVAISQVPPLPPYYALPFLAPTPPFSTQFMMVPSVQLPQMMLPNMPLPSAAQAPLTSGQNNVPYTTQQYRKRKEEREQSGSAKRKYIKKTDTILCKKCNQDRKPPAHSQYFGNWYCQDSETQSYEDWRAVLEQRGYGEKKRGDAH